MLSDREHVDQVGLYCPFCKSDRLDWDDIETAANNAYREVYCHNCGGAWLDVYQLVGWQVVTAPDPSVLSKLAVPGKTHE